MRWGLTKMSAGIAVAVVLIAGCSDKESGTAQPATTTGGDNGTISAGPTTTTKASSGGAPEVKDPLDATQYIPQPCSVLPATSLKQFNVTKAGVPDTDSDLAKSVGPSCRWDTDDKPLPRTYGVTIVTGNKNGLSDIYRAGKREFPGYFEPVEVTGYPAVFNGVTEDRPGGGCSLTVGISGSLTFLVGIESNKDVGAKGCDIAKQVAAAVIQTLKGA